MLTHLCKLCKLQARALDVLGFFTGYGELSENNSKTRQLLSKLLPQFTKLKPHIPIPSQVHSLFHEYWQIICRREGSFGGGRKEAPLVVGTPSLPAGM